jgi:RNA polymerase sigma-70 factor (ECF subfamily)
VARFGYRPPLRPGDEPLTPYTSRDTSRDTSREATSDAALLEAVATGDRAVRDVAFRALVERHRGLVHAICHRYFRDPTDAEDATQETFLTVLRRASTFRGEAQVSTWLYRVAVNTCHDMARHRARRPQTPVEDIAAVVDRHEASTDDLDALDLSDVLREALATLDDETRGLLMLCTIQEVPYAEVAEVYGIAVGTVKSRVHRARAKLAELLAAMLDDDIDAATPAGREPPSPAVHATSPPVQMRGPPDG